MYSSEKDLKYFKNCAECGNVFYKRKGEGFKKWASIRFCSHECSNKNITSPIEKRFWDKVIIKDGCWGWSGAKDKGYGILSSKHNKTPHKAHRLSYELHKGNIPSGFVVRHSCDNPECTNPDHLELGTQKDNIRDMINRGRYNPKSLLNLRPGQRGKRGA